MLRIEVLPNQRLAYAANCVVQQATPKANHLGTGDHMCIERTNESTTQAARYFFATSTGIVQTIRLLSVGSTQADYFAFSLRPEIIWDSHLAERISAEIEYFERAELNWLVLSADGRDHHGREAVSAHFNFEPDLTPTRGRRQVALASGLLYVVNLKNFDKTSHLQCLSRWRDSRLHERTYWTWISQRCCKLF